MGGQGPSLDHHEPGACGTLAGMHPGTGATLLQVGGDRAFRRRLLEMGLLPGTHLRLVAVAPLGDPLQVAVRGGVLTIRRAEALALRVRPDADRAAA